MKRLTGSPIQLAKDRGDISEVPAGNGDDQVIGFAELIQLCVGIEIIE